MRRNIVMKLSALAICLVGMAYMVTPSQAMTVERMAATENGKFSILSSVLSFYHREYSPSGPEIKIFELGGGDPAMNGAFIYISIDYNSNALVWETGLNVRNIQKISFVPGNKVLIEVKEDFMNSNSSMVSRKKTYKIQFYIDNDVLQHKLTIESNK
jgi:hypothetical protein